jgi:hypothetical protein
VVNRFMYHVELTFDIDGVGGGIIGGLGDANTPWSILCVHSQGVSTRGLGGQRAAEDL